MDSLVLAGLLGAVGGIVRSTVGLLKSVAAKRGIIGTIGF